MDYKTQVIEALKQLRKKEQANKEVFKVKAYSTVIKNLELYDGNLASLEDVKKIKGVGKGIFDRIKELMETGTMKQLEKIDANINAITELCRVHGIGPAKAKDLVEKHNIMTLEQLAEHQDLLNATQIIGLKYYKEFEARIPRAEMIKHDELISKVIKSVSPDLQFEVVGSYRRGAKDSGDIDVIITSSSDSDNVIQKITTAFKKEKYLKDSFAEGPHKYLGVCKLPRYKTHRRIDLLYATTNAWPFSIMYFTGSSEFNIILRNLALSKGLSLSEYGFKTKDGKFIEHDFKSEQDIFEYLGLKYIAPIDRKPSINLENYKL